MGAFKFWTLEEQTLSWRLQRSKTSPGQFDHPYDHWAAKPRNFCSFYLLFTQEQPILGKTDSTITYQFICFFEIGQIKKNKSGNKLS